jgi:glycerol-1-phosphate dehydrogenase [NAD(P)+]
MEALLESGFCMLDFGSSLPASGAEHHYSHFWEMKLLREGKPAILHGAKVGVAAIFIAGLYERIKRLSPTVLSELLAASRLPSREEETRRITEAYGSMADEILRSQAGFIEMTEEAYDRLKLKIFERWSEIQDIAREVPEPQTMAEQLRCVGGPTTVGELGLSDSDLDLASGYALYLRNHFTVSRLARIVFQGAPPGRVGLSPVRGAR